MLCIYHESTDPYFNVATDEYILKHFQLLSRKKLKRIKKMPPKNVFGGKRYIE